MLVFLALVAAVASCAHGMPIPDECQDIVAILSGNPKIRDLCFTDNTRFTSNSGQYWGDDAFKYLRVGGDSFVNVSLSFPVVLQATGNYDMLQAVISNEVDAGEAILLRIRYFNGKIRSGEAVWNAAYHLRVGNLFYTDSKTQENYIKLIFYQATAACKAHGVQDTITWNEYLSLRKPPADEIFMFAHNNRVCKFLHLQMFLYSVPEGRPKEKANHCIHAAQTPRPDSNGQIKCHDHYKPKYELFSESEVRAVFTMKAPEMVTYIQEGEKFYMQEREKVAVSRGSVVAGASTAACLLLTAVAFATSIAKHS